MVFYTQNAKVNVSGNASTQSDASNPYNSPYSVPSTITIVLLSLCASMITVTGSALFFVFKIDIATSTYIDPRPTAAGNILVIASFYFYRNLRTINNYLILNLAIADLIIGVYSMNVYTVYVTQGKTYCITLLC